MKPVGTRHPSGRKVNFIASTDHHFFRSVVILSRRATQTPPVSAAMGIVPKGGMLGDLKFTRES